MECEKAFPQLRLPICDTCGCPDAMIKAAHACDDCPPGRIHLSKARAAVPFVGVGQTIVEKLKYGGHLNYATYMADRMGRTAAQEYEGVLFDSIIPVPLHAVRRRERGFNQSEVLAAHLAETLGVPLLLDALRRSRPTPSQTKLNKKQRRQNIKDAFAPGGPSPALANTVLLVDDVYTTGATMNECARVLVASGQAKTVYCLAFARACL